MADGLEIERKYLIALPDESLLRQRCSRVYRMEQTYLLARPGVTARVRCRSCAGQTAYFYTEKERLSDMTHVEREREITASEYDESLRNRDPAGETICKTRWCLPWQALTFEIDVYPNWKKLAVMEVELSSEQQAFTLPPEIRVLREVTGDRRLKNAALARHPLDEEILLRELAAQEGPKRPLFFWLPHKNFSFDKMRQNDVGLPPYNFQCCVVHHGIENFAVRRETRQEEGKNERDLGRTPDGGAESL
jgi:CYTH domain-containing protein